MDDISKKIGDKIRMRRKYLGLSLENLSYSLHCSVQTVAKYEKAVIRVPSPVLYEISKILKTNLDYFFADITNISSDQTLKEVKNVEDLNKYPINVLFIEDNFSDELLIKSATKGIKDNIFILREGPQLLNYLNNQIPNAPFSRPDLIVLNIKLKNISGVELLSIIKRNPKTRHIPILIYSNHCEVNTLKHCYQQGACGFISKTSDTTDCIKTIQKTIDYWSNCVVLPREYSS